AERGQAEGRRQGEGSDCGSDWDSDWGSGRRGQVNMQPALRSAGALLLACTGVAQAPPPAAKAPSRDFAVRCGQRYVEPRAPFAAASLVVRDGKVASWGKDAPPPELPVVDYGQRVVMPGIVAVDSDLAAARDDEYAVTPDFQAIDGFDFEAPLTSALQGGV